MEADEENVMGNTSDNKSSRRTRNRGRMHQRSARRDTFDRNPVESHISLSLREILASKFISKIEEPPDNFRLINVYPSVKEITTRELPFIRPIIKNGAYQSVEHYLDVQFRLMKEDFTASLRNGVCTYLEKGENQESDQQFDVRVYEKVQFLAPHVNQGRLASLLKYTTKVDKKSVDENSKRFKNGSLLCFTSDNFVHISFGTVVDTDIKYLRQGQIIVDIREGKVDFNKKYTMVECTVFFEPYFRVLMALKKMYEDNFPFKDYIINVTSKTKPPKYINATTTANFMDKRLKFKILSPETWPRPDQVGLNESQFKAFQSALSQEFCVIQGPPGTGKTYTTLRIVEFLIKNKLELGYTGPIFVICFTNHALDQFLEGIMPFTNYLLRVGGQSKSIKMKNYSLYKYREILKKIVYRENKRKWGNYGLNENDYHPEEHKYNFSDYVNFFSTRNEAAKEYYLLTDEIERDQELLNAIISFKGVLNLKYLVEHNIIGYPFTYYLKTNKMLIEWLMDSDEKIYVEHLKEEQQRDDCYFEIRLKLDELYSEGKTDDYILTPNDYLMLINTYQRYDGYYKGNENERLKRLKYQKQMELYTEKMENLKWRLKQCQTQNDGSTTIRESPEHMKPDDRWRLYRHWLHLLRLKINNKILAMDTELHESYQSYQEMSERRDIYIMKKMHVIGMTTTGAATHQKLLKELQCPIVIAEEAAEVLESHIIVSLTDHCQHLILIGDHQQLRPNTAQYNLAIKYNLEISLFERMVTNGIHCQQLNIQHRMRPEIAKLIVPAIYPKLENSSSVEDLKPVLGVTKNLFFINHSKYEDNVHNSTSFKNLHEAQYIIRLAIYFIKQGYAPEDITILTTYKGQMHLLLEEKQRYLDDLEGVHITVVDNFQGEENKIILLSLVRSNKKANIGFLKTENRVCVALSRAKEGFFIIGNMENLEKSSIIWPKIKQVLVKQNSIGPALTLKCQFHSVETQIKTYVDFEKVSDGGCDLYCGKELRCGHSCTLKCHYYDREHKQYRCKKLCEKGHPCQQLYKCATYVPKSLPCGHSSFVPCSMDPKKYKCTTKINVKLPCGHSTTKECNASKADIVCPYPCKDLIKCGHKCQRQCHINDDPNHEKYSCREPCDKYKIGCTTRRHKCRKHCSAPCEPCLEFVTKKRDCSHTVTVACNFNVNRLDCMENCLRKLPCGHRCPNKCYMPCGNCQVLVIKKFETCEHTIRIECGRQIERSNRCESQCGRILRCGHLCLKKCNEECFCPRRRCNPDSNSASCCIIL